MRLPLENRGEAVLVAKDGQLLFANPAAARLFGYETGEDVINDEGLSPPVRRARPVAPARRHRRRRRAPVRAGVQMTRDPLARRPGAAIRAEPGSRPRRPPAKRSREPAPPPEPPTAEQAAPAPATAEVIQLPLRQQPSEADQELRAILDTAADGIITLDQEARIHTFSAGAEAIFGYRIAEVAGKPFLDLLAPESRKTVRDYLAALQGPGLAAVFNDGREVTALVAPGRHGAAVPHHRQAAGAALAGRLLRGGARHHAMEEDRSGTARGQGTGRGDEPAEVRIPRQRQP